MLNNIKELLKEDTNPIVIDRPILLLMNYF